MDLLNELNSSTGDNPLIVFDSDTVSSSSLLTSTNSRDTKVIRPKIKHGDKLELKHFDDQTLAQDYICKICQFMVVDPREHNVTGQTFTCSSLFCYNCIHDWIKLGRSYCPSPGCLTIGFEESAFREIGARDVARLTGLVMTCPFSCGLKLTYSDYTFLSHPNRCPFNPANICKICKSPKVDSGGGHDCRIVFNEMRLKIDSLNNKVAKLNGVIDQLRREVNTKKEAKTKTGPAEKETNKETVNKDKKGASDQKGKDNQPTMTKADSASKKDKKSQKIATDKQHSSDGKQLISGTKSGDKDVGQTKESNKLLTTFYSNSFLPKYDPSSGINLVFHYGERAINFDDVQSTYTIRTLRSLITDTLGHDPGLMLFIRHKLINDKDIIKYCDFQMGNNVITILPIDTPNYGEPGFRLSLYLPRSKGKSVDENKQSKLLNFYSNNLEPKQGANRIKLTLVSDNSSFMMDSVKIERTMGDIRNQAATLIGNNPIKMVYLTHLILEDNMTVNHYCFPPGTTDITLIPADCHLKYGANGALHLNRFQTNKSHGNKSPYQSTKSTKSTSLASLV